MLGSRRRAAVARDVVEDLGDALEYAMLLREHATFIQGNPCALIFAISALDLLMHALLHLAFEDSGPCRFIEAGDLQNVRRIDPVVGPPSHDMIASNLELIDRDLHSRVSRSSASKNECDGIWMRTLLYVAE